MRQPEENLQPLETNPKINVPEGLTKNIHEGYAQFEMAKNSKKPKMMTKVAIIPTEEEMRIIEAAKQKHGINSAANILRMALRRFAEAEGFARAS